MTLHDSNNNPYIYSMETDQHRYNTDRIDNAILVQNLNSRLFFEVYNSALDNLHLAFE